MLDAVSHVGVWVHDQDAAKEFYTEKLGFEVREDNTLPGVRELPLAHGRSARPARRAPHP